MRPDALTPVLPTRAADPDVGGTGDAHALGGIASSAGPWSISGGRLINARGQRFRVARHGLDKYEAASLAEYTTVIYGQFPDLTEVTRNRELIERALDRVSTRGDLFSVYASVYRGGSRTVLLLDYLR